MNDRDSGPKPVPLNYESGLEKEAPPWRSAVRVVLLSLLIVALIGLLLFGLCIALY
jgi:hypothetical protein